jgi:hypothetical protein
LKELLKQLEKMREIVKKHRKDIALRRLEDRHVLVSKLVQFPFQILKRSSRITIWNKTTSAITSRGAYSEQIQKIIYIPNKKHTKRTSRQAIAAHLGGKKM